MAKNDDHHKKKVVAISDLHCGSRIGLTPPKWQYSKPDKYTKIREECWNLYCSMLEKQKPIDCLLVAADCIEGPGHRQGGTDVLTTDRTEQVSMAVQAIEQAEAKHVIMTYGTFYHVGDKENWEDIIAKDVKADKISSEETVSINGVVFNIKHHVGRSSIPHGRGTSIAKERLWNMIWADRGLHPKADIILRGHVHYFSYVGEHDWLAMALPALCGLGSKYGARIPSETVDFGLVFFDVGKNGEWSWGWDCVLGETQRTRVVKL